MNEDLLVRVLVNYQLLAPYGEHRVYDTPLFGLCLEATRNTDSVSNKAERPAAAGAAGRAGR